MKFLEAEFTLDVGSGSHGTLTGEMMIGIEGGLEDEKLDVVLVEGDTNMVLAGVVAVVKLGVGHVEAGLRSYDQCMPARATGIGSEGGGMSRFTSPSASPLCC